jgi:hypothetical protein
VTERSANSDTGIGILNVLVPGVNRKTAAGIDASSNAREGAVVSSVNEKVIALSRHVRRTRFHRVQKTVSIGVVEEKRVKLPCGYMARQRRRNRAVDVTNRSWQSRAFLRGVISRNEFLRAPEPGIKEVV